MLQLTTARWRQPSFILFIEQLLYILSDYNAIFRSDIYTLIFKEYGIKIEKIRLFKTFIIVAKNSNQNHLRNAFNIIVFALTIGKSISGNP